MKPIKISGFYELGYLSNAFSEIRHKSFYLSLHRYLGLLEISRMASQNEDYLLLLSLKRFEYGSRSRQFVSYAVAFFLTWSRKISDPLSIGWVTGSFSQLS